MESLTKKIFKWNNNNNDIDDNDIVDVKDTAKEGSNNDETKNIDKLEEKIYSCS